VTDTSIPTIENLIQVCRDAEDGFAAAAEAATDPELKQALGEYAQQRMQFARDLRDEGAVFGNQKPAEGGMPGSPARRAWLKVRDPLGTLDDHTILDECERAEDAAVEAYHAALETPGLAGCLRGTVAAQFSEVLGMHRRIREWRERFVPAGSRGWRFRAELATADDLRHVS